MSHLEPLSWEDFSGQGHLRAETAEGTWIIGCPPKFRDGQVKFHYQLPNPAKLDYFGFLKLLEATERGSYDYWRIQNTMGQGYEGGYAPSQDDAKAIIDVLRSPEPAPTKSATLANAGFEFSTFVGPANGSEVFTRPLSEGSLSLLVQDSGIHLAYRYGSERHGLMRIERFYRYFWHNKPIPFFWPEPVEAEFQNYAVVAAVTVAERFEREERHLVLPRILAIGEFAGATPHYFKA